MTTATGTTLDTTMSSSAATTMSATMGTTMTITTITTTAAPATNVEVVCGDGADGYPNAAPYGRIILTASAWDSWSSRR